MGGDGGRSSDRAVLLNCAVCSDLFSFSFYPPLFTSAASTHARTRDKGHIHVQYAAIKGIIERFLVPEHFTMCYHVFFID